MKMKTINKFIAILMITIAMVLQYSCTKNGSNGTPVIDYVRINRPQSADSLLVAATQGANIVIVGENLGGVTECWFNNLQALLTPTYITNTNIMVQVPSNAPSVVTNKIKLMFGKNDSLLYTFQVTINKPSLTSLDCEYVNDGGVATIRGNYFYAPFKVFFPGPNNTTLTAVVDSFGAQIIKVTVPAGSQPGQITVTTNFGSTSSNFLFRDPRNIFLDSNPVNGWWHGQNFVVTNPGPLDPPLINGSYMRVTQQIGAWSWVEVEDGTDPPDTTFGNFPADAIVHPSLYYLKFEVNTILPFNGNKLSIYVGVPSNNSSYGWNPPYDSKGQWQTVVIPFDQVIAEETTAAPNPPGGYFTGIIFNGGSALNCDMCFDNFRIVPRTILGNN
jgi:hypothetical protein